MSKNNKKVILCSYKWTRYKALGLLFDINYEVLGIGIAGNSTKRKQNKTSFYKRDFSNNCKLNIE